MTFKKALDEHGQDITLPVSGAVLDNTIANPSLITVPGTYIVPQGVVNGVFLNQQGKLAEFNGETFTFRNAPIGYKAQINSGENAGSIASFNGTTWATTSGVKNTTSTTAPSLTNPAANTAFKNQMVSVTTGENNGDIYFVDGDGKAIKVFDSAEGGAELPVAIAIGTQAQLNALADKPTDAFYLVTDGANLGSVLQWVDTNDNGVGDTFAVAQNPTNGTQWTVVTNATGQPAGVYQKSSGNWIFSANITPAVPSVEERKAFGGIRFGTRHLAPRADASSAFIMYDSVAGFGVSNNFATVDGSLSSFGNTAATPIPAGQVRKTGFTYYQANSPYTQIINYRPFMTDIQQNNDGAVALDHIGVPFYRGKAIFMQQMTGTDSGVSDVATAAYVPDKFMAGRQFKVAKYWLAYLKNVMIAQTFDGGIWVKGALGTNGRYGDGTTTVNDLWHKATMPNVSVRKLFVTYDGQSFGVLTQAGEFYTWGDNTNNRGWPGATTPRATPVLEMTNVQDFAMDRYSTVLVMNDGSRRVIGFNNNGRLGTGDTTNRTTWTTPTSVNNGGFSFKQVFDTDGDSENGYAYITYGGVAAYSGFQNMSRGIAGVTLSGNVLNVTQMGTGAYQGSVVDIRPYGNNTLIHTSQGTVWMCVNSSVYQQDGLGIGGVAGNNIGINVFRQVPIPGLVASVTTSQDSGNVQQVFTVLTTEGRVFTWGYNYLMPDGSAGRAGPIEVRTDMFRQGEPKVVSFV